MDKPAETDHPIHDLLRRRWSPCCFDARPVEPEKLHSILEAARWAPSSFNEQPWAYLVATKDNGAEHQRLLSCLVEGNQVWAQSAPVLMISVAKKRLDRNGMENRFAWHDVGLASMSLVMQAMELGLFVHQMGGILPDKIRETYGVPEGWDAVAGIAVGYLGDPEAAPEAAAKRDRGPRSKRKPQLKFVFSEAWGKKVSW
jgi:nitroreductase